MDLNQIWEICSAPDNIPILILLTLVPIYTWIAMRQAFATDRVITKAENDPAFAKTHHRTWLPYKKEWPKKVHVWPHLLKIELLAAIILMTILIVWSIMLDAPLEEPANPNLTMNPSKAPWYFLGLQEMLVYFDPWIAGFLLPGLVMGGLMAIPYCDTSPLGSGYYTWKQRKFSLTFYFMGFGMWLLLTFVGVFIRGPGWMLFKLGETWDAHRVVDESYRHLYQIVGVVDGNEMAIIAVGLGAIFGYFVIGFGILHLLYTKLKPETYKTMNIIQYNTMQFMLLCFFALPIKMALWHIFKIKYILVLTWQGVNYLNV